MPENDETFMFNYMPLPADGKSEDIEWINYNCDNLTIGKKVANSFDETSEFLSTFENEIGGLLLSQKEANKVFELCGNLIDRIQQLNSVLISNSEKMNASQVRKDFNFEFSSDLLIFLDHFH